MYFILKYINYQEFKQQPEQDLRPPSSVQISFKPKLEETRIISSNSKVMKSRSQSLTTKKPSLSPSTTGEVVSVTSVSPPSAENKEVLINPDCYLGSILDYICEVTSLPRCVNFFMCTTSADLMNVNDSALSVSGLEFFTPKETYYIILKDYDILGIEVFFPLLHKSSEAYSYLMSKFRNESIDRPKKQSATSSSTSNMKVRSKEGVNKSKSRVKSATSQKEGKSHTSTLPPIKQKN